MVVATPPSDNVFGFIRHITLVGDNGQWQYFQGGMISRRNAVGSRTYINLGVSLLALKGVVL